MTEENRKILEVLNEKIRQMQDDKSEQEWKLIYDEVFKLSGDPLEILYFWVMDSGTNQIKSPTLLGIFF